MFHTWNKKNEKICELLFFKRESLIVENRCWGWRTMTFRKFSAETSIKSTVTHRPSSCIFDCNSHQHFSTFRRFSCCIFNCNSHQHFSTFIGFSAPGSDYHTIHAQTLIPTKKSPFRLGKYQSPQKPTKHFTTKIVKGASVLMTLWDKAED